MLQVILINFITCQGSKICMSLASLLLNVSSSIWPWGGSQDPLSALWELGNIIRFSSWRENWALLRGWKYHLFKYFIKVKFKVLGTCLFINLSISSERGSPPSYNTETVMRCLYVKITRPFSRPSSIVCPYLVLFLFLTAPEKCVALAVIHSLSRTFYIITVHDHCPVVW